ncbi:PilZ domain-containing protein [Pseudomonadota bacterium]
MPTTHHDDQNRRRFHRILFDTVASVKAADETYQCNIIDISLKGALISQPASWNEATGDKVVLEIQLSEDGTQIIMQGEVAHVETGHIGIQCNQIDIDSISHLRRLAELNLGDAELIERELAALN